MTWKIRHGRVLIAKKLLNAEADINIRNTAEESTPLHGACYDCLEDVVELLLSRGADVYAKDRRGRTPLDMCKGKNSESEIKIHTMLLHHIKIIESLKSKSEEAHRDGKDAHIAAPGTGTLDSSAISLNEKMYVHEIE